MDAIDRRIFNENNHICPSCGGLGTNHNIETGELEDCEVCEGKGVTS